MRKKAQPAPYMRWSKIRPPADIDLAGSNLLACTVEDLPGAREALAVSGPNPDGYPPLMEAIAARYGVSTDRVATAPGAAGANFLAFAALIEPGDDVLVERPGYDPLIGALRLLGASVRRFDRLFEEGYAVDPDRVRAALRQDTRLIVLTSPHNPSGVRVGDADLDELGRAAAVVGARVVVDEVYLEATPAPSAPAALRSDTFISTNSLTKAYGLSGLRCGWVLAAPEVAEAVRFARDVVDGVGSIPSDTISTLAFQQLDRLAARTRSILEPNAAALRRFMEGRADLEWVPPDGGTIAFPRLRDGRPGRTLAGMLARDFDTAVVPGDFFEAPSHFRISYGCAPETLRRGLANIGAALDRMAG